MMECDPLPLGYVYNRDVFMGLVPKGPYGPEAVLENATAVLASGRG